MNRETFIAAHPIEREFEVRGVTLLGNGTRKIGLCPFHPDKSPSLSVDTAKGLWNCHAGCGGGSVIDAVAKFDGKTAAEVLRNGESKPEQWEPLPASNGPVEKPVIEKIYAYHDALGGEVYQVMRMKPKTFRQRHAGPDGKWVWSMDGVERVLYRLPEVLKNQCVGICEGEKDADTLASLGICGTCNVGGAGKWLDGYSESLTGKDVLIFGDNDEPGTAHVNLVFDSIAGKAKTVRIIPLPKSVKDVSEYAATFETPEKAAAAIETLIHDAYPFVKGTKLPVYSIFDMEARYKHFLKNIDDESFELGKWLPSFNRSRRLVAGEVVLLIGDTGQGKTGVLGSIAAKAKPLPTLFFEMELPGEILFERCVAAHAKMTCGEVEAEYARGEWLGEKVLNIAYPHLFICPESRQTPEQIESIIMRSELKIGRRPKVVLLDYAQLIQGTGKTRYERMSNVAESVKVIAKQTRTIIFMASQITRPMDENPEITLHDAKESGSLENSAGLVLGMWRDADDSTLMHIKVLKFTKGRSGMDILCNFDGERMLITERSPVADTRVSGKEPKTKLPYND